MVSEGVGEGLPRLQSAIEQLAAVRRELERCYASSSEAIGRDLLTLLDELDRLVGLLRTTIASGNGSGK